MIECKNQVFGLHGTGFSCLLRVNAYGKLEQLHFGGPVTLADAAAEKEKLTADRQKLTDRKAKLQIQNR